MTRDTFSASRWPGLISLVLSLCVAQPAAALSIDEARHLLTRTGFGASPLEISALVPLTRIAAVDQVLKQLDAPDLSPPPAFLNEPLTDYMARLGDYAPLEMVADHQAAPILEPAQEQALTHQGMQEMAQLRVWWLDHMISTPAPAAERLALFWHNHFTSRYFDVLAPKLMFNQLQLLRSTGGKNFASLLSGMMRDPAMLIFLDNSVNTRKAPNENFARELLELFTLGIGHYSEDDIKNLARMLAGHSVDFGGSWNYIVRPNELDTGVKTFLHETGTFNADDAVRIILKNPRTAQFLSEKFYREYISPDLDASIVDQLAAVLRANNYEIRPYLRALFLSDAFWSTSNRGKLVKSPVELLVGFVRSFDVRMPDGELLNTYAYNLGQELFDPPSVEGWKGGMQWLSAQSIATRAAMIEKLWNGRAAGLDYFNAGANDLIVRLSAETSNHLPAAYRIRVNGKQVYAGIVRSPSDIALEGPARPKPMWEIARIAREQLPANIDSVEVVFDKQGADTALFINWMQVDGQRVPAYLAKVSVPRGQSCAVDGADIPKGMLYCRATLRFDLQEPLIVALRGRNDAATAYDRAHGPVNSIIESGTTRMSLTMRPGARATNALTLHVSDEITVLGAEASQLTSLTSLVIPVAPLLTQPADSRDADATLKAFTLDPTYNLK